MKYTFYYLSFLSFIIISLNAMSQTQIEVFKDGKLVAGDSGENVTVESLNAKMPFDITDFKYDIVITDLSAIKEAEEQKRQQRLAKIRAAKQEDIDAADLAKLKQVIKVLINELKE